MTSRLERLWGWMRGAPADTPRPPGPGPARKELKFVANAELEARLDAAPDDAAAWAIYGDWLQTEGDARGELLAWMDRGLDAHAGTFVEAHNNQLFGKVARFTPWTKNLDPFAKRRKFARYQPLGSDGLPVHRQRTDAESWPLACLIREVEFAHGFVARASVSTMTENAITPAELLAEFLTLPICRFLTELGFGVHPYGDDHFPTLLPIVERLAPRTLKRLIVGDFVYPYESEMSWADLQTVSPAFRLKNLDALTICGGTADLGGPIDGAHLRAFSRQTGGLAQAELLAIAQGTWTRLQRLELWLGTSGYGGTGAMDDLKDLLNPARLPAVTHLALKNNEITDALIPWLARCPLLPQLRFLDLSMGTLGPEGAAALVEHAAAYRHLTGLELSENCLTPEAAQGIGRVLPAARGLGDQKSDRFVSVSE